MLIKFKDQLSHHRCLYQYLQPTQEHMTPKFYGLPKIHKPPNEDGIPPIRPIISHTDSLLLRTARFIDHVLQPQAQSFSDCNNYYLRSLYYTSANSYEHN